MRRVRVGLAVVLVWLLAAELTALAWVGLREGILVTTRRIEPRPAPARRDAAPEAADYQANPYWAFSHGPGKPFARVVDAEGVAKLSAPGGDTRWAGARANNYGFWSSRDYPYRPEDERPFVVGVFGGSVAALFALQGAEVLADALGEDPALAGRPVEVLAFASEGYRQPQQLFVLSYFLLLGQRFDVILNLDGFNEVSIGHMNWKSGVDVAMPSYYHLGGMDLLARLESDGPLFRHKVALFQIREALTAARERRESTRSGLVYAFASLRERRLQRRLAELRGDPPREELFRKTLVTPRRADSADAAVARAVELWKAASVEMAALARSHGARYLHVLQPNQYHGARRFTEAERAVALSPDSRFREGVHLGYPKLIAAGAALRAAGVDFHDASALFDRVEEPIYADDCCHVNQTGNDRLAAWLAGRILAAEDRAKRDRS